MRTAALLALACTYARASTTPWPILLQKGPVCISGYYPIYSTLALAQAASPLGTAQEHTFSTYVGYMPNGLDGVTVPSNTSAGLPCLGNSSNVDATSYFFAPPPASSCE